MKSAIKASRSNSIQEPWQAGLLNREGPKVTQYGGLRGLRSAWFQHERVSGRAAMNSIAWMYRVGGRFFCLLTVGSRLV